MSADGADPGGLLQQATALHRQGRLAEAAALYRQILDAAPGHAPALHNLGAIQIDLGELDAGLANLASALRAEPGTADYWLGYVGGLIRANQADQARAVLAEGRQHGLSGPVADALDAQIDALAPSGEAARALADLIAAGDDAAAEASALAMTTRWPAYPFGWKALGAVLHRGGRYAEAVAAQRRALALAAWDPEPAANLFAGLLGLALALRQAGSLRPALAAAEEAAALRPDSAEAQVALGVAAADLGDFAEAERANREALRLDPARADAAFNLAIALRGQHRLAEAETWLRAAHDLQPEAPQHSLTLGLILGELGREQEALTWLDRALILDPASAQAHLARGILLGGLGRRPEAEAAYGQALAIDPALAEAHNNLGVILYDTGRLQGAEAALRQALALKPGLADAQINLGNLLKDEARLDEARAAYAAAQTLRPDDPKPASNLLLLGNYVPGADRAEGLEAAKAFGALCARKATPYRRWDCDPAPARLRVGLVSADLRDHPVGYFLETLLGALDPERIELLAYPNTLEETALTARIRPHVSAWRPIIGLGDAEAAALIHADRPHILLDLSGHTAEARLPLFAWRPAPVQASWLGYSNTTGVAEIGYFIGDAGGFGPDEQRYFTETLVALPDIYLCFTPPTLEIEPAPPPCLAGAPLTFGCFNNPSKLNDAVLDLWGRVMAAVPQARLLLKGRHYADPAFAASTRGRLQARGVAPERLLLEGGSSRADYFRAYNRIDIALDPFPFPGGTTTVEGFWMGVPVVTLAGDRFLARAGASFSRAVGVSDWIAADADQYVGIAAAKAADPEGLARVRAGLRGALLASPLCDAPRFARHLETALWSLWRQRALSLEPLVP